MGLFWPHWRRFLAVDWILVGAILPLLGAGLLTMHSFTAESHFFYRQLIWFGASFIIFLILARMDSRFLRRSGVVITVFACMLLLLSLLFVAAPVTKGARSWFAFGSIAFQPADFAKLALVLVLAKYFSRRHVEIRNFRYILVSGLYALLPFGLIFIQPDFGSAIVIFLIWLGMILVSGVSKKHLLLVLLLGVAAFGVSWFRLFDNYQRARIVTFLHPLADIRGAGYNAFQSTVAVGSGQLLGKGIGYGTQSRLRFLPEYETDFIFAAFAEEWGLVGVVLLLALFNLVFWRILQIAMMAETNFETLFAVGLVIILASHFLINVGMNIGLLPVTGLTLPFLSYGGSHLLATFTGLGLLMAMRRHSRAFHREDLTKNEFFGI